MKASDMFTCNSCGNVKFQKFVDHLKVCTKCGNVVSQEDIDKWRNKGIDKWEKENKKKVKDNSYLPGLAEAINKRLSDNNGSIKYYDEKSITKTKKLICKV